MKAFSSWPGRMANLYSLARQLGDAHESKGEETYGISEQVTESLALLHQDHSVPPLYILFLKQRDELLCHGETDVGTTDDEDVLPRFQSSWWS